MSRLKIKTVEKKGPYRFERIDPHQYGTTRTQWRDEFRITLPPRSELPTFGDVDQLIIILKRIVATIELKSGETYQYSFDPGFITDLASVPKFFRSLVDNDDILLLLAVLIHDRNFSTHCLSFRESNKLLYAMIRENGYSRFKSVLVYLAVNSIAGRARYNKTLGRGPWTEKTSKFVKFPR